MKPIQRSKLFKKHFHQRIVKDKKLVSQFKDRYAIFCLGVRDYPIHDHALTGSMKGKRAWSVANNIRVIYRETEDAIILIDIGTHAQVYK